MTENFVKEVKNNFGDKIKKVFEKSKKRVYVDVNSCDVPEVIRFLITALKGRFAIATGIDTFRGIELLYHISFDRTGLVFSVRTVLDGKSPKIQSLTPEMKVFEWIEREIHELLGVEFTGHPNPEHLLLIDDWPEGKFPLKKE